MFGKYFMLFRKCIIIKCFFLLLPQMKEKKNGLQTMPRLTRKHLNCYIKRKPRILRLFNSLCVIRFSQDKEKRETIFYIWAYWLSGSSFLLLQFIQVRTNVTKHLLNKPKTERWLITNEIKNTRKKLECNRDISSDLLLSNLNQLLWIDTKALASNVNYPWYKLKFYGLFKFRNLKKYIFSIYNQWQWSKPSNGIGYFIRIKIQKWNINEFTLKSIAFVTITS